MNDFLGYDPDSESDKEALGYIAEYEHIAKILGPAARVCEIGVFKGFSLLMWQDLFPEGLIAGVDVNPVAQWPQGVVRVVASQDDPLLPGLLDTHASAWDLIVDDASHKGDQTKATFELLWPRVAPGGFYVIEDWFIGLPHWISTGCWTGIPPGHEAVAASCDPGILHVVQDLLTRLDEPFRGLKIAASLPKGSDVESIYYCYGMAVVRKRASL